MKSITAAALAAVLLLGHEASISAPQCERILHVGAWNIEWLGNPVAGKRNEQKPEDIAGYIQAAGVEVLALAEISATGQDAGGEPRNKLLDAAFDQLNKAGAAWKYTLLPKRKGARAPEDQWIGAAWNERSIQKVGGPWRLEATIDAKREDAIKAKFEKPEPDTIIWSRWPQAFKFSAGSGLTDFILVPVHLKSNSGGAVGAAEARTYEVELLLEALDRAAPQLADKDIIVLGDSNMLVATEPAAAALIARGMKDCNGRDLGTHLSFGTGGRDAPFDRVFLMSAQPETQHSCPTSGDGSQPLDFKVVRPADWLQGMSKSEFRKRLSDHQMVRVGVCVTKDDD
jgi:hypothetical protein